eukprot:4929407-Pyramimonas_sp.AAC.1
MPDAAIPIGPSMPIDAKHGGEFNIRRLSGCGNILRLFMRARAGGTAWIYPDAKTWVPDGHVRDKGNPSGGADNFQ